MQSKSTCTLTRDTLVQLLATSGEVVLPTHIANHLSECTVCRARLLTLVHGVVTVGKQVEPATACETIRADLPAFLELEQLDPVAAVRSLPHTWRHLWSCASCMDEYLTARTLVDLAADGVLPPLKLPVHTQARKLVGSLIKIVLRRQVLSMLLPVQRLTASPARGSDSSSFLLFDHSAGDPPRQFTIVVEETSTDTWEMHVTAVPPVTGLLLMTIGIKTFTSRFHEDGTARITDLPADVLLSEEADLEIAIMPLPHDQV